MNSETRSGPGELTGLRFEAGGAVWTIGDLEAHFSSDYGSTWTYHVTTEARWVHDSAGRRRKVRDGMLVAYDPGEGMTIHPGDAFMPIRAATLTVESPWDAPVSWSVEGTHVRGWA